MFGKRKQPPIKSLIASGTVIRGDVEFRDGLRIDGEVHGNVHAAVGQASLLVISETASVVGALSADLVVINGHVQGPVNALDLLELQPKARVQGDVSYKALEMHQGATIAGQLAPVVTAEPLAEKPPLKLAANNT